MITLILAAGKGTRMKSKKPKVLHKLGENTVIDWVLEIADKISDLSEDKLCVVCGDDMPQLVKHIESRKEGLYPNIVFQMERLGSGHAVMACREFLGSCRKDEEVLILSGDVPLISEKTIEKMLQEKISGNFSGIVLTSFHEDPTGYGRMLKDEKDNLLRIVEDKDTSPEEKKIKEVNSGIYVVENWKLLEALKEIKNENKQREYYLTDIVEIFCRRGWKFGSVVTEDNFEVSGINDRIQLSCMEKELRRRINLEFMKNGVTIVDSENTFIGSKVKIGMDTAVHPYCFLSGNTEIGEDCIIGPFSQIHDSKIGNRVNIERSHVHKAFLEDDVSVGPFARIREKTHLKEGVKIGDFVELKKTEMGKNAKAQHLSYLGDSFIGENVNIGAGTITCNYDGYSKHVTDIGDNAFIGSNTALVAPVKVGRNAIVGAGSVIVNDVSENSLAIGRGRQVGKEGRANILRELLKNKMVEEKEKKDAF